MYISAYKWHIIFYLNNLKNPFPVFFTIKKKNLLFKTITSGALDCLYVKMMFRQRKTHHVKTIYFTIYNKIKYLLILLYKIDGKTFLALLKISNLTLLFEPMSHMHNITIMSYFMTNSSAQIEQIKRSDNET